MTAPVEPGDYGPVRVVAGPQAGRTGYYDDDDEHSAIVYCGEPFVDDPILIPRHYLVKSDEPHLPLEAWAREHPRIAAQMGIAVRRE